VISDAAGFGRDKEMVSFLKAAPIPVSHRNIFSNAPLLFGLRL
jgi:hypothetical protein